MRLLIIRRSMPLGTSLFSLAAMAMLCSLQANTGKDFKAAQLKNPRVKQAYHDKEALVLNRLKHKLIDKSTVNIFIRVLKKEKTLEVWAKSKTQNAFLLLHNYEICASSGDLGPKRSAGDGQVPEGFYYIDRFQPNSNFYLALGLDYPNQSDRILGRKGNLGGDIFIHGACVTIGCVPLTDDKIKELYILAVEAKASGQEKVPVHIFPCEMDKEGMSYLEANYKDDPVKITFWKSLKKAYDYFETRKKLPLIVVRQDGSYLCN